MEAPSKNTEDKGKSPAETSSSPLVNWCQIWTHLCVFIFLYCKAVVFWHSANLLVCFLTHLLFFFLLSLPDLHWERRERRKKVLVNKIVFFCAFSPGPWTFSVLLNEMRLQKYSLQIFLIPSTRRPSPVQLSAIFASHSFGVSENRWVTTKQPKKQP